MDIALKLAEAKAFKKAKSNIKYKRTKRLSRFSAFLDRED